MPKKSKKTKIKFTVIEKIGMTFVFAMLIVSIASAQTFQGIATNIGNLLNLVVPILFMAATVVFLAGVVKYIAAAGNEEKREEGKQFIFWGLIGLFVMVAIWGIINLFVMFFFSGRLPSAPDVPQLPGYTGGTSGGGTGSGGGGTGGGGTGGGATGADIWDQGGFGGSTANNNQQACEQSGGIWTGTACNVY